MEPLESLFKPSNIRNLKLKNRIVMAPMFTMFADENGFVSDQLCSYYEERAKGGVGFIIVENTAIAPGGESHPRELSLHHDKYIPGLQRLSDIIHRYGVKTAIQLHHTGRQRPAYLGQPVAPSPIPCRVMKSMPRELATEEVDQLVEDFAQAARRAKEAGFDAVEFHGAHGYLICQFLSGYTNKRTDKYGGDLTNRMRFALHIVMKTREKVGDQFPILFRISAKEYVPTGLDLDETRIIARNLQDVGVNCLDISAGNYETGQWTCQPSWLPRGCLVPLADDIKRSVTVPVIVAGRINDPILANSIVQQGKADFVALGRPLLADPEFPKKAKEGKFDEIRMCMACCHCMDTLMSGQPLTCAINASIGKEAFVLTHVKRPKRILIVGGGPGGMEAARIATIRGHEVTLYEKEQFLGGQLHLAAIPPGKEELTTTIKFLASQLTKLAIDVKLSQKISAEQIISLKPDAVIIATGSYTSLPDIPGANLDNVVMARDVISGKKDVGRKVVVVGGGRVGCETAEVLAKQGKDVTLVRMSGKGRLAGELGLSSRASFLIKLYSSGILVEAQSTIESINESGVVITKDGQSKLLKADTVVLSPKPSACIELANQLKGKIPQLHIIGDCVQPRGIADAIHEGFAVGCNL